MSPTHATPRSTWRTNPFATLRMSSFCDWQRLSLTSCWKSPSPWTRTLTTQTYSLTSRTYVNSTTGYALHNLKAYLWCAYKINCGKYKSMVALHVIILFYSGKQQVFLYCRMSLATWYSSGTCSVTRRYSAPSRRSSTHNWRRNSGSNLSQKQRRA